MLEPPSTPREAERLASLRRLRVLDTGHEERFDRLTRIAALVVGVPMATVSLVDADRQWFKSRVGMDADQTPRSVSFCGHAILADAPLVVPDALDDRRFAGNPLVTGEPHIRFYAGFPLDDGHGHKLGTLCVMDRRARTPTTQQLAILAELAALAEQELRTEGIERVLGQRQEATQRLDAVTEAVAEALVAVDQAGRVVLCNQAAERLFGRHRAEVLHHDADRLLPDVDLRTVEGTTTATVASRGDGSTLPVTVSVCRAVVAAAPLYVATIRDDTASRDTDRVLRRLRHDHQQLIDQAPVGVFLTDDAGRYVAVNRRWCEIAGMPAEAALGTGWVAAVHPDDTSRVLSGWSARWVQPAGHDHRFEADCRFRSPSGRVSWVGLTALPRTDEDGRLAGYLGFVRDVTGLRAAQQAVRTGEEIHRAVVGQVRDGIVVSDHTGQVIGCNPAAEQLLGRSVEQLADWCAPGAAWAMVRVDGTPLPPAEHPVAVTLRTGQPTAGTTIGFRAPAGDDRWITVRSQPLLREGHADPWGVCCTITDGTPPDG